MISQKQLLRFLIDRFSKDQKQKNPLSEVSLDDIGYNVNCKLKTIPANMQVCKAIRKIPKGIEHL